VGSNPTLSANKRGIKYKGEVISGFWGQDSLMRVERVGELKTVSSSR